MSYDDLIDEVNELNYKIEGIKKILEIWELGVRVAQMDEEVRRVLFKCCEQLKIALGAELPLDYNNIKDFEFTLPTEGRTNE